MNRRTFLRILGAVGLTRLAGRAQAEPPPGTAGLSPIRGTHPGNTDEAGNWYASMTPSSGCLEGNEEAVIYRTHSLP